MDKENLLKKVLVYFYDLSQERALNKKAGKIIAQSGRTNPLTDPPSDILKKYRILWNMLPASADPAWLKIYGNISGIWDHRYVPETIYYNRLEPCLNNKAFSKGYTDKNFYSALLNEFNIPETLISNIEGVFYNNENRPVDIESAQGVFEKGSSIIIKPAVDSGGGRKVTLWKNRNGRFISDEGTVLSTEYLLSVYKKNFIIQKAVEPHPFYKRYNSTSLNTIRVLTYRSVKDESINILHCVFRIGATGSITDNQSSGGYACGITSDGNLTGKAVDKWGNRFNKVNEVLLDTGTKVEGLEKIRDTAIRVASKYHYSRLLGQDICLDSKGNVRLIEVNNVNNEINFFQMLYGPLFQTFTEEVVIWCSENKRSFLIDFEI